jgi:Ni/Co efflux regulator RcnB
LAKPPVGGPQAGVQHGPYGEHGPSGATGYQGHGSQGERYQAQGGAGGPPRGETNGPNGYRPYPGAGRPYEHATGPHEVIPPGADHGHDNRYEGHMAGGPPDHNGYAPGRPPGPPQRWAPGRYPSVYDSHQRYHADIYRPPYGYYVRPRNAGEFLPRTWFVQSYWLTDFIDFGLPYPPPGFTWVRVGPDAIMIDQYTGRIVQVVHSVFW